MGSDHTHVGKASSSAYGMTKAAIGQLTKSTAIDYAKYNVWVIASVAAFLLSDENSFMTGSLVSADGGYVCQ